MIEIQNASYVYPNSAGKKILNDLNFFLEQKDFIGLQGKSGSGKSTFFYILGLMLKMQTGTFRFKGRELSQLTEDEMAMIRSYKIGFVFQQFHLLPHISVWDNLCLPLLYPCESPLTIPFQKILDLADTLGLKEFLKYKPNQLSGGQQQRVAIARALIKDVDLILADEPTGNLDEENAKQILDIFHTLNEQGKTICLITHDPEVAARCHQQLIFKNGKILNYASRSFVDCTKKPLEIVSSKGIQLRLKAVLHLKSVMIENILKSKLRSFLMMIGVGLGTAAIFMVVSLSAFMKKVFVQSYESLGVNVVHFYGHPQRESKFSQQHSQIFDSFSHADTRPLKNMFPEIKKVSLYMQRYNYNLYFQGSAFPRSVEAFGVEPEYFEMLDLALQRGKGFNKLHLYNHSAVCILGSSIAQKLFGNKQILHQKISLNCNELHFDCQVIGVLNAKPSSEKSESINYGVFLPLSFLRHTQILPWHKVIDSFIFQVASGTDVIKLSQAVKNYFEVKYQNSGFFRVSPNVALASQMKRILYVVTLLMSAIALVCFIVGGIGIYNMMLASITERIREFGLRRALGATRFAIYTQVLGESFILCMIAGFMGVFLGFLGYQGFVWGASLVVSNILFAWDFNVLAFLYSLISIFLVGFLSGFIPAKKADRLDVIVALTTE